MNITPTQNANSTTFTSRFFINTTPELATRLKKEILPFCQSMSNKKIAIVDMTAASETQRNIITQNHAKMMNCTPTWLQANAKNNGFNIIPDSKNHDIFILTDNDINKFQKFMKKLNSPTKILFDLLFKNSNLRKESKKYPEHLQKYVLDQCRFTKRLSNIYDFLQNKKNYKETKDIYDLIENLISDKI